MPRGLPFEAQPRHWGNDRPERHSHSAHQGAKPRSSVSEILVASIWREMKLKIVLVIISVIGTCLSLCATSSAHPASGIVLDHRGNVFFSDLETIWKIDTNGKL